LEAILVAFSQATHRKILQKYLGLLVLAAGDKTMLGCHLSKGI